MKKTSTTALLPVLLTTTMVEAIDHLFDGFKKRCRDLNPLSWGLIRHDIKDYRDIYTGLLKSSSALLMELAKLRLADLDEMENRLNPDIVDPITFYVTTQDVHGM